MRSRKSALVSFKTNITTYNLSNFLTRAKPRRAKINLPAARICDQAKQ